MSKSAKLLLSIVIAAILCLAAWHLLAGRSSALLPLNSPEQTKAGPRPIRPTAPEPVAVDTIIPRIETPPEIGTTALRPIEIKDTPAGQVKILRTFGPDGKLRQEEVRLNDQLQAVRKANSEGLLALEVREDPQGQIRIQRTFNVVDGQVVKKEAFQNGVPVPLPQKAGWE